MNLNIKILGTPPYRGIALMCIWMWKFGGSCEV